MNSNPKNRRSHNRIIFDGNTHLSQGDHHWQAVLLDISLKGLLIEQPKEWDADTTQPLQASIQLDEETLIAMVVHWRHSNNGQIGFECKHIDIDSIGYLRRLVELNLGDENLLERELSALGS